MTRKHAVFNLIRRPILTHEVAVSKNTFLCEAGYHSDNVYHSCAYESLNGVIALIMTTLHIALTTQNTNMHTNEEMKDISQ